MDRGYILFPRELLDEEFWRFTPVARQVFLYLMLRVNYVDGKNGYKRGQGFFSYGKIKEDLSWYVGFRKHTYSDSQIRNAMNHLATNNMISTTKSTRGLRVTILKYDSYQNPKYYERHNEQQAEQHNDQHDERTQDDTLYVKERKNNTKTKEKDIEIEEEKSMLEIKASTLEVSKSKGQEEVVGVGDGEIKGGQIRHVRELAMGWLKWQPESELYLIRKAVQDIGFEKVAEVTKYYSDQVNNGSIKENIVSSSRYWWSSGVYSWANKVTTTTKIQEEDNKPKMIKRKCNNCHVLFEFEEGNVPSICTNCNEGMLLNSLEYASEFPQPPKPEPEPEVLSEEDQEAKDKVMNFLNAFK